MDRIISTSQLHLRKVHTNPYDGNKMQVLITAHCILRRSERYIEDIDRFPGWKGELPVPILDFEDSNNTDASASPFLTIGFGADGKVLSHLCLPLLSLEQGSPFVAAS